MNPLSKLHKRLFAWVLSRGLGPHERLVRDRKQRLLGALSGTVLELGPGGGGNLAHLGSQVDRWLGLEPNPYFAPYLAAHPHEPYHRVQRLLDPCWGWLADGGQVRRPG